MICAHKNEIKPMLTGTACMIFLSMFMTCGVVGAFF
jgi:hypothetical protein